MKASTCVCLPWLRRALHALGTAVILLALAAVLVPLSGTVTALLACGAALVFCGAVYWKVLRPMRDCRTDQRKKQYALDTQCIHASR